MFLTKLFALFWLLPLVVSGSCPQDQKQISVRVTAEFRLHSFIKTVDHETTITASMNFATSFKKCRLAMKSGNSTNSFGDAVQNILDTVSLAICTAEADTTENFNTKRNGVIQQWQNGQKIIDIEKDYIITNFLQLVRVITYSVRVDEEMAKIQEKTTVDSIPVSSAGNYGDRVKYGAIYIEEMFQNEKGGNIVHNTFTVSTCYNESSQQEINELIKLKVEIQTLKKQFTDLTYKNNIYDMELTDLTYKFRQRNNTANLELTGLTNKFQQQNNRTNMQISDIIQQNKLTNKQLSDLIQQNNRTNMELTGLTNKFQQQENRTNMQILDLIQHNKSTNKQLSDLTDNVYQLNTSLKQMNTRQLNSLKIVKAHGGLRAYKCKFTCVGTTGRDSTMWVEPYAGYMWTHVSMVRCRFVDVPVVTTSLAATGDDNYYMLGTAAPRHVTTGSFFINLQAYVHTAYRTYIHKVTVSDAKSRQWNVNWAAYGYKEC